MPLKFHRLSRDAPLEIYYHFQQHPLGFILMGRHKGCVCYASLHKDQNAEYIQLIKATWPQSQLIPEDSFVDLDKVEECLIWGTDFQVRVWQATHEIPYGETATYTAIAQKIGRPQAVRAVGSALARNHICLCIPCHRVRSKSGGIGQFRWGVHMKRALVEVESFIKI